MKHVLCTIFLTLLTATLHAITLSVRTQQDFDLLSGRIASEIRRGEKNITVVIEAPKLTFADNQILLKSIQRNDVSISIHGKGVQLTSRGHLVRAVTHPSLTYLKDGKYYNPWTPFRQLSDTISIADASSSLCRITTPERNRRNLYPQDIYINYTCWYTSRTSPVTSIGAREIEFDGGDWAVPRKGNFFNVNMDYAYAGIYPRYRLFGTKRIPNGVYECEASNLVKLERCSLRSFLMDSVCVTGSSSREALILVQSCHADSIAVRGCTFRCIGGTVLMDRQSSNVCFSGNLVDTFMGYGVESEVGSTGAKVTANTFSNCTLGMEMGFAIKMRGDNFIVRNNTISDFCYGGIGVGIYAKTPTECKCRGTISDNELYYTDAFLANLSQHTLMDTGAIYTWTRTDGVTISNNYIHDIAGIKSNSGIFCDDGAKGITLSDNRIERIHGGYDIDLRWCETYKADVPDHNSGNRIFNNQTTGKVRFETQRP